MNKYCFFPHPSSQNHGCEAIAISSFYILRKHLPNSETTLLTKYLRGTSRYGDNLAYDLYDNEQQMPLPILKRFSLPWLQYQIGKLFGKDDAVNLIAKNMLKTHHDIFDQNDVFVSIGGDNYCYGRPVAFYAMNRAIHKMQKKSVLWGCSIEPSAITEEMLEDLRLYNKIITRESITYQALCDKGLQNVKLYPDPAFTLLPVPCGITLKNTIGINISPMILDYATDPQKVVAAFRRLMNFILENTDCDIALIPHVTASTTNDIEALRRLKAFFADEMRVTLYEDMDCQKLKSLIAQCRMFVGARTHATIAAYSSCVPTLVCGYSVKAKGIATDLFGTYENYVVPVQGIDNEDALKDALVWLLEHEKDVRDHLNTIMPEYIQKAWDAGKELINGLE